MPKLPIDYSKSCVYRLIHNHTTYYVGSTTNFVKRKNRHKSDCINVGGKSYNLPLYKFIRETGGWIDNDWDMILIESYPECKTSEELRKYERFHYDIIRPELNVYRPHTTEEENKEYRIENRKAYYNENRDKISEQKKKYSVNNSDKISEQKKVYYNENRDSINEHAKVYYNENCDKINEKKGCECGGKYTHTNISKHLKTKKHQAYLASQV